MPPSCRLSPENDIAPGRRFVITGTRSLVAFCKWYRATRNWVNTGTDEGMTSTRSADISGPLMVLCGCDPDVGEGVAEVSLALRNEDPRGLEG